MQWKIVQCDYLNESSGKEKVVNNVHWEVIDQDGEHQGRAYGSVGINIDDLSNFTEFENLTEADVVGWVKNAIGEEGVDKSEETVAAQLEELKNPTKGSDLPW